jgi:hypothetical protein
VSVCLLLCEDKAQERLFRPLLETRFKRVRVEPRKPQGGWEFVKDNIARLAATERLRRREAVALLVVFDGDTKAVKRRAELREIAGLEDNRDGWARQVGVCVPSRNVETWLVWLTGRDEVDEVSDFKESERNRPGYDQLPRRAAEAWFTISSARRELEKQRLPALAEARGELDRILTIASGR